MMAAEDVIAWTIAEHRGRAVDSPFDPPRCTSCDVPAMYRHSAEAVVAAIRGMSPSDLAQLIGGEVLDVAVSEAPIFDQGLKRHPICHWGPGTRRTARVVGPWMPLDAPVSDEPTHPRPTAPRSADRRTDSQED